MPLEIEIKFLLSDPAPVRRRLICLGAASDGSTFEQNIRFEDPRLSFRASGSLLRLRMDRRARLTFKSRQADPEGQFKVYRELEVAVDDFDRMHRILEAMGFHPAQRYEKRRETFHLQDTEFCLDSLPFGEFIEIEGQKEAIRKYAGRLGLAWDKRILTNYLQIFDLIRRRRGLAFSDITFANFEGIRVDSAWLAEVIAAEG
jgi:adenylate cyclase class 2